MNITEIKSDVFSRLKNLKLDSEFRVMEVCGTHTVEFFKTGIRSILPEGFTLVDGPGCPVCVTPNAYLDRAIAIAKTTGCVLATFGDMLKVPSSYSSLMKEKAEGMKVMMVYSPAQVVDLAEKNPDQEYVFLSVGFETTAPIEALTIKSAAAKNLKNFSILTGNKLTPPAVKALLDSGETKIDAFILPGHVSAVIGRAAWDYIANDYSKLCVVAGFSDVELAAAVLKLIDMRADKKIMNVNMYPSIVRANGNPNAVAAIYDVFSASDSEWRGIGVIPESGLKLKDEYSRFDAEKKFPVDPGPSVEPVGCKCGELLRGLIAPDSCPLFGKACTPDDPVGPCMVSSEGPCAAFYKYGELQ